MLGSEGMWPEGEGTSARDWDTSGPHRRDALALAGSRGEAPRAVAGQARLARVPVAVVVCRRPYWSVVVVAAGAFCRTSSAVIHRPSLSLVAVIGRHRRSVGPSGCSTVHMSFPIHRSIGPSSVCLGTGRPPICPSVHPPGRRLVHVSGGGSVGPSVRLSVRHFVNRGHDDGNGDGDDDEDYDGGDQ